MRTSDLLRRFEAGEIDPASFDHRAHVMTAVALLQEAPFLDAAVRYVDGIRTLAASAGVPHKVNLTITLAFLSVIAERLEASPTSEAENFLASNTDLLAPNFLLRWYEPDRLNSPVAGRLFLMA